ncbi:MAG: HAMP domain-containing histidine kinase, partial [Cyclobacteriaceae bacterium]|nr:HAMP domain-containing histidine kinase [Cyclobacteriaceae bacterium]
RQARIFDMFYRGTELSHGSGLGLFIVKEIVQTLGGTIDFESSQGVGSVFTVKLPVI